MVGREGDSVVVEFQDLHFVAVEKFNNGYEVSVTHGGGAYSSGCHLFEVAVFKEGQTCPHLLPELNESGVAGWLLPEEVDKILGKVASLKKEEQ